MASESLVKLLLMRVCCVLTWRQYRRAAGSCLTLGLAGSLDRCTEGEAGVDGGGDGRGGGGRQGIAGRGGAGRTGRRSSPSMVGEGQGEGMGEGLRPSALYSWPSTAEEQGYHGYY